MNDRRTKWPPAPGEPDAAIPPDTGAASGRPTLPHDACDLHHRLSALPHVTVTGTGHWLHLDKPEAFHHLLEAFLVQMPLTTTFWSPRFGMVMDRFGVGWMINVAA